jgi:riboflavin biosynthesis pyrimidine reductase
VRRLHPDPADVEPAALFDALDLGALAPPGRPYVVVNMVASVDGRAAVEGRSGPLGGPADRAIFFELRASVDAVLAGTGTLRAEQYGRLVRKPERMAQRVARGLEPEPVALILSRSGDVPSDIPLLQDPEARPVVLTGAEAEPAAALERVRSEHGVRSVLCEGGPSLNASLLAAGLVDELFLTVSPLLAATADPLTIVGDAGPAEPVGLELVWVLEDAGMLFCRYAVRRSGGRAPATAPAA